VLHAGPIVHTIFVFILNLFSRKDSQTLYKVNVHKEEMRF